MLRWLCRNKSGERWLFENMLPAYLSNHPFTLVGFKFRLKKGTHHPLYSLPKCWTPCTGPTWPSVTCSPSKAQELADLGTRVCHKRKQPVHRDGNMPHYQLQGPRPHFHGRASGHSDGAGEEYGCGEAGGFSTGGSSSGCRTSMWAHEWDPRMQYFSKRAGGTATGAWPPADPCPLVPAELFSLWLPLHDRPPHPPPPASENESLVYFPQTNKKSRRCSGAWRTLRLWGLSGPEPFSILSSNKQHFRAQEAFRGHASCARQLGSLSSEAAIGTSIF